MLQSLEQMRNRGNGKGGGIAAVGLDSEQLGVDRGTLEQDYLLAVAYLDASVRKEVELFVKNAYEIDHVHEFPVSEDWDSIEGLEVRPPDVAAYFVRPRAGMLATFAEAVELPHGLPPTERELADEYVFQTSFRLNTHFYAGDRGTQAFVLSHGRNLLVLKMVGYGDDVIRCYQLENLSAHVWIGHHRYPTKGKVWHPGGAHPFVGLNEALVHNGDFANYEAVCDYLAQRGLRPLFQTDTEVSVQVFDLHHRLYGYPLEWVIESLAPTTERDFTLLPPDRQELYDQLQATHIHGSPDGPWFFIIAQSVPEAWRLIGITDTSMLRPQVFALQEGEAQIAFAASEKQVIDAALESLSEADNRFWPRADRYWNARGGSHTDGGAFIFSVVPDGDRFRLQCTNKFGERITLGDAPQPHTLASHPASEAGVAADAPAAEAFAAFRQAVLQWGYGELRGFLHEVEKRLRGEAIALLTLLLDRRYPTGELRRSSLLALVDESLERLLGAVADAECDAYCAGRGAPDGRTAVLDARGFDIEGPKSLAIAVADMMRGGWRRFLVYGCHGHRFIANAFGPDSGDICIDVYGSSGDYLGSGMDGARVVVHGNGQDQLGQILKSGELVVHGDVGQTFMYGAKGGHVFVQGNAAGRPLINSVGRPRVVINGTCLDYLAESFMAGDPLNDGGFVILNGLEWDDDGELRELPTPYPGGNLFSLASGGAIYVRDPHQRVTADQLNGGDFAPFTSADWAVVEPLLRQNEREFGLPVARLLEVNGQPRRPGEVYRRIQPAATKALQAEEVWVAHAQNG
ncbi:MAG: glutamate synthase [Candidatus Poseidoniia archaeon]|nr:glutamate synthase [Candidatus Poseidoniia archaeon]